MVRQRVVILVLNGDNRLDCFVLATRVEIHYDEDSIIGRVFVNYAKPNSMYFSIVCTTPFCVIIFVRSKYAVRPGYGLQTAQ